MQFVTIDQFNEYTNNYEDSTLKSSYIESAEQVVKDYLGFDPEVKEYREYFSGMGDTKLYLNAHPIQLINEITINGMAYPVENFEAVGQFIRSIDRRVVFPSGDNNIYVSYVGGFDDIPGIITISVLRIASLILQEAGGNIGLTGKAFGDNSRTYINYSNYEKYLRPLDGIRIIRV